MSHKTKKPSPELIPEHGAETIEIADITDILDKINSFVSVSDIDTSSAETVELIDYTDADDLKKRGFGPAQIDEIQRGLAQGLEISRFAKPVYNWMQMREIRIGLMLGIDVSKYENPLFSANQMREIRFGLVTFVDIEAYARLNLSAMDMRDIRRKLFAKSYSLNPKQYGRTVYDDITGILVHFSDDCLKAYLTIPEEPVSEITRTAIMNLLEERNIVYGVQEQAIDDILTKNIRGQKICIAEGKPSSHGKDGWYQLNFDNGTDRREFIQPDDVIDYTSVNTIESVEPGQVLAIYHPAQKDVSGVTVYGIEIDGVPGTDLPKLHGVGFTYDEGRLRYIADRKGYPSFNEITCSLNIWDVYQVNGDVNLYQSVEYDGAIHIHGNVSSLATVRATGDIIVDGYVEGAALYSDNNIVIKGGANPGGKGIIFAKGSIKGKFFENAILDARGNVEGNYFLNCKITTDECVKAYGKKARIMGGNITAAVSVDAVIIGNYLGFRTVFTIGDIADLNSRMQELNKSSNELARQIAQLNAGKEQLEQLLGPSGIRSNALYEKTMSTLHTLEKQVDDCNQEIARLASVCSRANNAYVKVHGELQEGVVFFINGNKKTIAKTITSGITLTKEKTKGRGL